VPGVIRTHAPKSEGCLVLEEARYIITMLLKMWHQWAWYNTSPLHHAAEHTYLGSQSGMCVVRNTSLGAPGSCMCTWQQLSYHRRVTCLFQQFQKWVRVPSDQFSFSRCCTLLCEAIDWLAAGITDEKTPYPLGSKLLKSNAAATLVVL
jgi:hypothetical protein